MRTLEPSCITKRKIGVGASILVSVVCSMLLFPLQHFGCHRERLFIFMSSIFTLTKFSAFSVRLFHSCSRSAIHGYAWMPYERAPRTPKYNTHLFIVLVTMILVIVRAQFYPFSWGSAFPAHFISTAEQTWCRRLRNTISPALDFDCSSQFTHSLIHSLIRAHTHAQMNPTQQPTPVRVIPFLAPPASRCSYPASAYSKTNPILLFLFFFPPVLSILFHFVQLFSFESTSSSSPFASDQVFLYFLTPASTPPTFRFMRQMPMHRRIITKSQEKISKIGECFLFCFCGRSEH